MIEQWNYFLRENIAMNILLIKMGCIHILQTKLLFKIEKEGKFLYVETALEAQN